MWTRDNKNFAARGFSTPPATWKSTPPSPPVAAPMSERNRVLSPSDRDDDFHVVHKVPAGDSPYVRAKQVQLIDKDPSKAISLFWAAINAGDRVDSALKDMAIVMKQLDRAEEAIEAIKSFRHLCPYESQESLNNVLVELYKRAGRIEEEIEMLQSKLKHIDEGIAFGGRRTKTARSQGKKVQITIEQERSRILGNLAWAYMQQGNYQIAEEYYMKALSLEPDKNKQCNLAICLMHMNRFPEAKSLLQVVRASSGNKPMDESYAKSFDRAFQMLSELEAQSVLRPIQRDEIGQHYGDKWTKDCNFRNSFESRSSFSSRMKENQGGGIIGAETTPNEKSYYSLAPAIWNPEVPFTQPRRSSWGFNDGHQTRKTWGCGVGSSNKKLPFERCSRTGNVRAHVVRNLNEMLASTTGKSEVKFQNSVSSLSSPTSRDLRRNPEGDAAVRSVLQPILIGKGTSGCFQLKDGSVMVNSSENTVNAAVRPVLQPISIGSWKGTSGCSQLKHESVVVNSSENTVNGDWRRICWENGGMNKSEEPLMVGENAKALEVSIDGGQNQISNTTFVEGFFVENTSRKLNDVHQAVAENQKLAPDFLMYRNSKKSWADMAEEEEELLNERTEYTDSWNTEDEYNNENLNCNIAPESPCLQTQMKSLGHKLESVILKDEHVTCGNSASPPRNSTVRRSLCFDQQQEPESVDYFSSSPAPNEAHGKNSNSSRRKRLQSFQDITAFQDSP